MTKPTPFNIHNIAWQPEPGREHEINGYVWDNIQGKAVNCAHVFTELGCCGYWYMWGDYPGSKSKSGKYEGRCADSTKLGLIGTIRLIENKWKELSA